MDEKDLRDCFAMFALLGYISKKGIDSYMFETCYALADAMIKERSKTPDMGITAVKPKRRST